MVGLVLVAAPVLYRIYGLGYNQRSYQSPVFTTAAIAATPIPTPTPMVMPTGAPAPENELKRGPVVVDLAHFSLIERDKFQPLAAALASYGVDLRFWLPTVDPTDIERFTDFPDQSEELTKQLTDASALVVVSPFFLYSDQEIAVVERFVGDGGRLLLISDPDIESDAARDTNQLASVFNIVFNEDYLYDTVDNDENYTYFFQGQFLDRASDLADSRIAFYGGRSISGATVAQVRSARTALSSLRSGLTDFTTVALGGQVANNSLGRVLAMSDFEVLTDPFVARHDNRKMLGFVAEFLAGALRENTLVDFPAFLGKEVALLTDSSQPMGATGVSKAAELQRFLEASGRTLGLASNDWLSDTAAAPQTDLIYVAGYRAADSNTSLLSDLGIELVEEVVTPTVTVEAPSVPPPLPEPPETVPEVTPTPALGMPHLPETPVITGTVAPELPLPKQQAVTVTATTTSPVGSDATVTPTPAPTVGAADAVTATTAVTTAVPIASPTPEVTPEIVLYLQRNDGIRLVADETQLFIQQTSHDDQQILAVLGDSEQAITTALTRLLNRDLAGCLIEGELTICPVIAGEEAAPAPSAASDAEESTAPPLPSKEAPPAPKGDGSAAGSILLVDDNLDAKEGEKSEAAIYLTVLTAAGYQVDLWLTGDQGVPDSAKLGEYGWVIWSDAGYDASGIEGESLRAISEYINQGGHVTVSSRMPFFGVSSLPPSPIKDVIIADGVPELVEGLPEDPIVLADGLPAVVPLESDPEPSAGARAAMLRGPASEAADAPVLAVYSDENFDEPKGALLMLSGMSIGWLPSEVSEQLIQNMATVMLAP